MKGLKASIMQRSVYITFKESETTLTRKQQL